MERRLIAPPDPNADEVSRLWLITNADRRYMQTILYDPAAGAYRSRIRYCADEAGRLADMLRLWDYHDGVFESTDEALEFGELAVESHGG
jgi:hypothetical protein